MNYLEIADIDTVTTGTGVATADAQTDGITVNGLFLPLNQFHFHSPSEHTLNGQHFPLEMHMVHKLFWNTTTNTTIPASQCGTGATQCALKSAAVIGIMFAYTCAHPRATRVAMRLCWSILCLLADTPAALCAVRTAPTAPS